MLDASENGKDVASTIAKRYGSQVAKLSVGCDGTLAAVASNVLRLFHERELFREKIHPEFINIAARAGDLSAGNLSVGSVDYRAWVKGICKNNLS